MTWPELFRDPPASATIRYRTGLKRAPGGETLLVVQGDGLMKIEHRAGEELQRFEAKSERREVVAIFGALAATGFPGVLAQTVPPGAGIVAIEVLGGPAEASAITHRAIVRDSPAWSALVAACDALCAKASGGRVKPG